MSLILINGEQHRNDGPTFNRPLKPDFLSRAKYRRKTKKWCLIGKQCEAKPSHSAGLKLENRLTLCGFTQHDPEHSEGQMIKHLERLFNFSLFRFTWPCFTKFCKHTGCDLWYELISTCICSIFDSLKFTTDTVLPAHSQRLKCSSTVWLSTIK